ncbi:beta-microseminoprotein-like [Alosa pseudoharengus]|uniref:beta-microseminoprotein-like n=1 Tax=Alosa pseudoharengus TaxID=34774 RepID=UPI003F8CBE45
MRNTKLSSPNMRKTTLILILGALVPLAYTYCYQTLRELKVIRGSNGEFRTDDGAQEPCQDTVDKDWHPVGATWTNSRCEDCSCSTSGMWCCDRMGRPVGYGPDCMVLFDWEACSFDVVKKNDRTIHCEHGKVGK